MISQTFIGSLLLALSFFAPENIDQLKFASWKQKYSKRYTSIEDAYRFKVYLENVAIIEAHNLNDSTYKMGENQFTAYTDEEFIAIYLPMKYDAPETEYIPESVGDSVNWSSSSKVKSQGTCGSCWAFSAVGAIESYLHITQGISVELSEQQLLDCERTYSLGCDGGYPDKGIAWSARNGLVTSEVYPYKADTGTCRASSGNYKIKGSESVTASNLKTALKQYPISATVDATNWSRYASGIFSNCGTSLNHAVLAVGYDEVGNWLIKNSWGTTWGEDGFIRLAPGNTCGVTRTLYRAL